MTQAISFGQRNFGHVQLGDKRRTERLVELVDQMCLRPGGTLPQKFRSPADLRAFYRLMDCKRVTHEVIMGSHRKATLECIAQRSTPVLILHDSTELDFTTHRSLDDLGQIGSGKRRGYITHNSLAVDASTGETMGLVNQELHRRANVPKSETHAQRRNRSDRESRLWLKGVMSLPNDWNLVDVCDRGADTTEFIEWEVASGRRFVIRSSKNRCILTGQNDWQKGEPAKLHDYICTLPVAGTWEMKVTSRVEKRRGKGKEKMKEVTRHARTAQLAVSFAAVQIDPSERKKSLPTLKVWAVRVWEIDPPQGQERLEWILLTNEPLASFEDAHRVVGWYECRWVVEELHKGMKTGCKTESLQFTSEDRLKPAIALLSVVTQTLLQLRDAARAPDAKTRKASTVIGSSYVEMLSLWRHKKVNKEWTVHEFFYALARLGGHQNRKQDHLPGWQVIWEGWKELLPMAIGYATAQERVTNKCG